MSRVRKACLLITFLSLFMLMQGCFENADREIRKDFDGVGSYMVALKWNGGMYETVTHHMVDKAQIDNEIGKISKEVRPMPKLDGEINNTQAFKPGDLIYSLKENEISEAIAVKKDDKYYKIYRVRSSLGIVWDNGEYDFQGNFAYGDERDNVGEEIGKVKNIVKDPTKLESGIITVKGVEADATHFSIGSKIYKIKNNSIDEGVIVQGKDGKYHKATYIRKVKMG
ncbi:hypothetical protein [Pseudobacteroides cellulosolvens]|uniref:Lipoprotein n=1 Tax=Pseudobacteroides cellulosolvens ATCC 35603 = DSM 2933 TaxID=398512 RepID=A0A0L6JKA4_9FIRM|nr:hypothetical protein [Pseudobacteroides cellulosolvens]KNY26153.1 hypothetical protein Bccel_1415 [Pseudobacteroides cellulosolvens ATCC 35603 = DSM 2933]